MTKTGTPATTFIYALNDPRTGLLRYIGKSDDPVVRFRYHLSQADTQDHRGHWIRSLLSQGLQPELQILFETPRDGWQEIERRIILTFRRLGFDLVNSTDGGEGVTMTPEIRAKIGAAGVGRVKSAETCAKLSAAMLSRGPELSALQKARTLSAETRAKIGAAAAGRKHSEKSRARMKVSQSNRSEETRLKLRAASLGHLVSEETRVKLSAAQTGKTHSIEARAKISAARLGKKMSEAARKNMSEAQRRQHARKREEKLQNGNAAL